MDSRNTAFSSRGVGQQGRDDRMDKKTIIIRELGKLFRQYMVKGEPAGSGGAVGATLAALIGASAVVEEGPRLFDYDDVHQQAGGQCDTAQRHDVERDACLSHQPRGRADDTKGVDPDPITVLNQDGQGCR